MSVRGFGRGPAGDVLEIDICSPDGLEARVITWGAALRRLRLRRPDGAHDLVLGYDRLEAYLDQPGNLGAVIGRYANRIAGGSFVLDGIEHQLVRNEGRTTLHGGPNGFGRRSWTLLGHGPSSVQLALFSDDGDMGFPGRLVATALYETIQPLTLRITLAAFADRPTPVNLTTHSYYALGGPGDARRQILSVRAKHYLPVGPDLVPTGVLAPVAGTPFDFRRPRAIGASTWRPGYDVNLVLASRGRPLPTPAAMLRSPDGRLSMELRTTEPGLQLYDGHKLGGVGPCSFGPFAGVALEPQRFPDAPNRPSFPSAIVRPGRLSRQVSEAQFAIDER